MALSRDDIFSASDSTVCELTVPEWGGTIHLRTLTGTERDAFEASIDGGTGRKNLVNIRGRFAALVVSDAKGERLFTDADATAIAKKSAVALQRILDAGLRHNHMTTEAIEDAEKNS